MKVTLIDHMGTDYSVVNSARVSFSKHRMPKKLEAHDDWSREAELAERDAKLINYLAKHNHWSPFSHTCISLHVKAPIFVARQLAKHQVGGAWNEVSRRYVSEEPEFYWPDEWRKVTKDKKQGSSDEIIEELLEPLPTYLNGTGKLKNIKFSGQRPNLDLYNAMLEAGICEEQARMILPQNTYTEFYWSGSLYFFARVVKLRTSPDAQKETQEVANQISKICQELFPISWSALINN